MQWQKIHTGMKKMQHLERKHLATFATIAKTGSLTKTAEQLFISQSALSHQIKKLEHNLNCQLLRRLPQGIVLTEQGKAIAEKALSLLPQFEQLEQQLITQVKQQLTIAMPCYYCFQWLMPVLHQLAQSHQYQIALYDEVFEQQPNCDLLFVDEELRDINTDTYHLGEFELVVMAALNHPVHQLGQVSLAQLVSYPWLTYPVAKHQLDLFKLLFTDELAVKPSQLISVQNSLQLLQKLAAGMGLALIPNWLASNLSMQHYVKPVMLKNKKINKSLWLHICNGTLDEKFKQQISCQSIKAFTKMKQMCEL